MSKKGKKMTKETLCFEPGLDIAVGKQFTIGQWVRHMRRDHEWTLQELADRVGTSKSYIWEIENKPNVNPSFNLIMAICEECMGPVGIYPRKPRVIQ
ncbi:helix-turn-helix transcriptional regulator [candidate division KSB1 bacterium]|nr:helix-turn-helix transcriptional regulator [candidate division KSB1 bacterium]NIV70643.1 helix-turn-helix domain-containing protein [Phycisphaerae bacterium]NIS28175.1 helix-turn-helix transcriptional regulator [candidate division KSB1 bacterium]NIT75067.1 helix-turn-helix transcriptional regulator [candidate division KSB1 bacterium]NIU28853.1 helix-turn-helix transcriptional regulator [candidate division KSB1 bacterium]